MSDPVMNEASRIIANVINIIQRIIKDDLDYKFQRELKLTLGMLSEALEKLTV